MNDLIKELEKYQAQIPDYGAILLKIMLRKEKDRDYIFKHLIEYIKRNPKVNIVDIRQEKILNVIPGEEDKERLTVLAISFLCGVCSSIVEEEIALRSTWIPRKTETELICTNCCDDYSDEAYDAAQEQRFMEEEESRLYAENDKLPDFLDLDSSDPKKKDEKE